MNGRRRNKASGAGSASGGISYLAGPEWGDPTAGLRAVSLILKPGAASEVARARVEELGGEVTSAGPGVIIATLPGDAMEALLTVPEIARIETPAPMVLRPKF